MTDSTQRMGLAELNRKYLTHENLERRNKERGQWEAKSARFGPLKRRLPLDPVPEVRRGFLCVVTLLNSVSVHSYMLCVRKPHRSHTIYKESEWLPTYQKQYGN